MEMIDFKAEMRRQILLPVRFDYVLAKSPCKLGLKRARKAGIKNSSMVSINDALSVRFQPLDAIYFMQCLGKGSEIVRRLFQCELYELFIAQGLMQETDWINDCRRHTFGLGPEPKEIEEMDASLLHKIKAPEIETLIGMIRGIIDESFDIAGTALGKVC